MSSVSDITRDRTSQLVERTPEGRYTAKEYVNGKTFTIPVQFNTEEAADWVLGCRLYVRRAQEARSARVSG